MINWLKTDLRNEFGRRSLLPLLLTVVFSLVFAGMLIVLLTADEKFVKVAVILIVTPLFMLMPAKEKIIMSLFLFSVSLGTGKLLLDETGTTVPPLPHGMLLRLSDLLLYILLALRIFYIYTEKNGTISIWHSKVIIPLVLWMAMGIFSLFPAVDRVATLLGVYESMIRAFITFFVIFHFMKKQSDLNLIIYGLLSTLFFQTIIVVGQQLTQSMLITLPGLDDDKDDVDGIGFRPSGTMGHSSNFAKLTGEVLPIALAYGFFANRFLKVPALVVWIAGAAALALTVSRAALGSWLITSALFPIGLMIFRVVPIRPMIPLFSGFMLIIILVSGLVFAVAGDRILSRMENDHGSANTRAPMWQVARNIISAHPLMGIGLKNYTAVHRKYDNTEAKISIVLPLPVHNLYLLTAAEIGLPGAIFFFGFIAVLSLDALRCTRSKELNMLHRSTYLSMLLALMTILLQGYTGKGFVDHLAHISIVAIYAACSSKALLLIKQQKQEALVHDK